MKMRLALPVLMLSLAIAACGKKDQPVTETTPINAVPAPPTYPVPPSPYPTNPVYNFSYFCQQNGGQMSGNMCRIERNYQAGYSQQWGNMNTGVAVYTGERVFVNVSGTPRVYVGSTEYGTGTSSFVATNSGYLNFQRFSQIYSVQQIRVQTCFSDVNVRATCP